MDRVRMQDDIKLIQRVARERGSYATPGEISFSLALLKAARERDARL